MKDKKLASGYSAGFDNCEVYHFKHMERADAEAMDKTAGTPHVIESIVWVSGDADKSQVHFNRYFLESLSDAVRFAAPFSETGETLISIRPATSEERKQFKRAATRLKRSRADAVKE